MKTHDFYYDLPEELIAQTPVEPRDHSRMLVVHRKDGRLEHRHFYDIVDYLRPGDVLVVNDTRVIPARLIGERAGGGAAEVLLLKQLGPKKWETLVRPGRRLKPGAEVTFGGGKLAARMLETTDAGGRIVEFVCEGTLEAMLDELGEMPLPPYIHEKLQDRDRYQTVYARHDGSAAAPTAGLHFTPELMEKIREMGVQIVPVLLHVGLGTFRPVKAEDVEEHEMHSEYYEVTPEAAAAINAARAAGGRVVAVGTTSVRTLESASTDDGVLQATSGWTNIFITPGYHFKMVDALITNFHLPESTLVMLVSAFYSREGTLAAYEEAVREKYSCPIYAFLFDFNTKPYYNSSTVSYFHWEVYHGRPFCTGAAPHPRRHAHGRRVLLLCPPFRGSGEPTGAVLRAVGRQAPFAKGDLRGLAHPQDHHQHRGEGTGSGGASDVARRGGAREDHLPDRGGPRLRAKDRLRPLRRRARRRRTGRRQTRRGLCRRHGGLRRRALAGIRGLFAANQGMKGTL